MPQRYPTRSVARRYVADGGWAVTGRKSTSVLLRMVPKIVDAGARRQDVVQAVLRIIAVDGLERASLREVADEAGLAVGSVRHYFAGSDELLRFSFAAVVDRILGRLRTALPAMLASEPGSDAQRAAVLTLLGELLPLDEDRAVDGQVITALVSDDGDGHHSLTVEAERLLATLDGLCMHALLQPAWMTAQM